MERQRKCSREMRMSSTGKQNLLQPKLCSSEVALSIESESAICSVRFDSLWPYGLLAHQAPLSMGFTRQGSWSGLSFPSPGDLSNPGIKPRSPANCRQILYWLSYKGRFTDIRPLQYIYLPAVCPPWRSKMLFFLLSFLYKCIVLGWRRCKKPEF